MNTCLLIPPRTHTITLRYPMAALLVLILMLAAPPSVLGVSRFHERNHTGLLFLYGFDDGQLTTTAPTHVRDLSGRYLMGNLTTSTTGAVTWSAARQGMTIPSIAGGSRATSQLTSAGVLPLLTNEFSLEFFFSSPLNPVSQNLLIAGFGDWPPGTPFPSCDAANMVSEGGWRLFSSLGTNIQFFGVLSIDGTPTCVNAAVSIAANTLRHLVVRVQPDYISMVSHGSVDISTIPGLVFAPSLWARHSAPLTIATPHVSNGWTGVIYMVALYNRYLSTTEIAANRVLGPPNSLPFANVTALVAAQRPGTVVYP
mgnify:CR=1 FL=1